MGPSPLNEGSDRIDRVVPSGAAGLGEPNDRGQPQPEGEGAGFPREAGRRKREDQSHEESAAQQQTASRFMETQCVCHDTSSVTKAGHRP